MLHAGATLAAPILSGPGLLQPAPSQKATPFSEKMREGHQALAARSHKRAEASFRGAMALDPASPLPWLGLAESARIQGDRAAAEAGLAGAARVAPRDPHTLLAQGRWHYAMGAFDKAEAVWKSVLEVDPRNDSALIDLGGLALDVKRQPAEAADFYRRALAVDPTLGGAHHALGMSLWQLNQPTEAIAEFEKAAKLSPKNPLPVHAIGQVHAQMRQADLAIAAFDRAIGMQPAYYAARVDKSDLLASMGQAAPALAELELALRDQPKLPDVHVKAGMLQQQLGRDDAAMSSYKKAIALDPKQAVALNNLAWLASGRGDVPDRGLRWAQDAVALNDADPRFKGTLAWVLHKRGESAKALKILEPLVQGPAKDLPDSRYLLALIYTDRGERKKAADELQAALRINPSFSAAADAKARLAKLQAGS